VTPLHWPWIELAVFLPLAGALWVRRLHDPDVARRHALVLSGMSLIAACIAWLWLEQNIRGPGIAQEQWDLIGKLVGHDIFTVDELSAPLLPLAALLYFLTALATLRTKVHRFSFSSMLVSESILLATLACKQPWAIVALLAAGTAPPWLELRARGRPTRVYAAP
jgi:NADH-quinone oxidoreductase subunit M